MLLFSKFTAFYGSSIYLLSYFQIARTILKFSFSNSLNLINLVKIQDTDAARVYYWGLSVETT